MLKRSYMYVFSMYFLPIVEPEWDVRQREYTLDLSLPDSALPGTGSATIYVESMW